MEYKAKRKMLYAGKNYETNQLVPVKKEDIDSLKKYNFIANVAKKKVKETKSKD